MESNADLSYGWTGNVVYGVFGHQGRKQIFHGVSQEQTLGIFGENFIWSIYMAYPWKFSRGSVFRKISEYLKSTITLFNLCFLCWFDLYNTFGKCFVLFVRKIFFETKRAIHQNKISTNIKSLDFEVEALVD